MLQCTWRQKEEGNPAVICTRCGRERYCEAIANCNISDCRHLKEERPREDWLICNVCPGKIIIKTFTCALHGKVTVLPKIKNQHNCQQCNDYEVSTDGK